MRRIGKRGILWPMVMAGALLGISLVLVISYAYFGLIAKHVIEKAQSPDIDAEKSSFLPLLLQKKVGNGVLADVIADGEFDVVKREINEWLFVRFDKNIDWNLYVGGTEVADNQLVGFIKGREFVAYIPSDKGPIKVELEVSMDAWDGEVKRPFFDGVIR